MPDEFPYDVFLSHSAKDKAVVRPLAERLRADGVKVWFDERVLAKDEMRRMKAESELHPSSFILHPLVVEGLERSRVLVLCMSANAFGSDSAQLESGTLRTGRLARVASTGVHIEKLIFDEEVFLREMIRVRADIKGQRAIAAFLDTGDEEICLLRAKRAALDQQKRGLLQRLPKGKVRVQLIQ